MAVNYFLRLNKTRNKQRIREEQKLRSRMSVYLMDHISLFLSISSRRQALRQEMNQTEQCSICPHCGQTIPEPDSESDTAQLDTAQLDTAPDTAPDTAQLDTAQHIISTQNSDAMEMLGSDNK
jgi:hypothetical protein